MLDDGAEAEQHDGAVGDEVAHVGGRDGQLGVVDEAPEEDLGGAERGGVVERGVAEDELGGGAVVRAGERAVGADVVRGAETLVGGEHDARDDGLSRVARRVDDALDERHVVGEGGEERREVGGVAGGGRRLDALRVEREERHVDVVGDDARARVDGVVDGEVEVGAFEAAPQRDV